MFSPAIEMSGVLESERWEFEFLLCHQILQESGQLPDLLRAEPQLPLGETVTPPWENYYEK